MSSRPDDLTVFRALLESTPDNIYAVDRDLRYTHVSRGATALVGLTPEQMIGRNWRELGLPQSMEKAEAEWRLVLDTGQSLRREAEFATPGGDRVFEYVMFPIREGETIVGAGAIVRDVTDRATAEREMRRAEERYRGFLAHSSEGIWRFEVDDPIPTSLPPEEQVRLMFERAYLAECNDTVAHMYGFETAEEMTGIRLHQLMDPAENRDYLLAFVAAGYRLADAESVEVDRFGRRKYFLNSLTGIIDQGRICRAWGMQRDITDQKAWTERLRLSEERLQALVEASAQVVWTTDAAGRLDWITPAWSETTGQPVKDAKGMGWLDVSHPADRPRLRAAWEKALETRSPFRHIARFRMDDGNFRWLQVRAAPVLNDDGSLREWVGAYNDVDAERRQEEIQIADQLRAEFIADANDLFVRSLDYEETLRNLARLAVPRLADWCAVDMVEPDGTLRRLAVEHVDPSKVRLAFDVEERYPTDPNASLGIVNVIRTGETEWLADIPEELITAAARSAEHLQLLRELHLRSYISTPIRVRDGIAGVLTLVAAESERRFTRRHVELAEALALRAGHAIENSRLYQQAVEANRAKDDFLATLSHELRTPLTAILGWANLLRLSNYEHETMRAAVETIERSARTQAAIIDDLLDVSRIITGKFHINPGTVDIVPILRNVVESVHPAAEGKRLRIDVKAPETLTMRADPNRLQQIIWNLISNAVKFSNDGGTISVEVVQRDDDAEIRVTDHGIGIAPEILARVFDRFWQADSSSNRAQGGLGLGLAIVKHLVEMHGGTVEALSEGTGKGATFIIRMPIGETERQVTGGTIEPRSMPKRVLLVDDDEAAREVIARILEHHGARVTRASSAPAAFDIASREPFDLILTDLAMPDHDGYWLLERMRESHPEIPVAAITAFGVADERISQAGFRSFIRKPVDPAKLAELLQAS